MCSFLGDWRLPSSMQRILVVLTLLAGACTQAEPAVNFIGRIAVGMSRDNLVKVTARSPERCATCDGGQTYVSLQLTAESVAQTPWLVALGVSTRDHDSRIDVYLDGDHVSIIRAGWLVGDAIDVKARALESLGQPQSDSLENHVEVLTWSREPAVELTLTNNRLVEVRLLK